MEDCYRVLGVKSSASAAEIKRAFRRKAKSLHPDIPGNVAAVADAELRMRELILAYETLSDPSRRAEFDATYAQFSRYAEGNSGTGFDYRAWLMERDDAESRAKLIFFDLLHGLEEEAVLEYRAQRARAGGFTLSDHFDREDFMDCGFILAEELAARDDWYEAFLLLERTVELEYEKPYFKHFFPEALSFARDIARNHLVGTMSDELALDCLEAALELRLGKKDDAFLLRQMAGCYDRIGDARMAALCLSQALRLEPSLTGTRELRKKLGV